MRSYAPFLVAGLAAQAYGAPAPANECCTLLANKNIPLLYPDTSAYDTRLESYFDVKQQSISPYCIAQPRTSQQVADAVKALATAKSTCKFAIRSGGHTPYAGASNIKDGVTIDLQYINSVSYSSLTKRVTIGAGAQWRKVFEYLQPLGVISTGGRWATVGAGGLITGGGISYFSPEHGMVCNNVVEMEVALADGRLVTANKLINSDLFRVLKGGNNNFGIVTSFKLKTFKYDGMWGGAVLYPGSTIEGQFKSLVAFTDNTDKQPKAAVIVIQVYSSSTSRHVVSNNYAYAAPVSSPPAAFDQFRSNPTLIPEVVGPGNMTDFAEDATEATANGRAFFGTLTFANDIRVLNAASEIYYEIVERFKAQATGTWSVNILYQPLPPAYWRNSDDNGGTVLGLERNGNKAFILYQPYFSWEGAEQDKLFQDAAAELIARVRTFAESNGLSNSFLYLDYADITQNPLPTYGIDNVLRMKAASRKYDPKQVFQKLVPGGFKISKV